ncbi:hypothetical protein DBR11_01980 [Pedobacter sp. HMWF019]|uniref:hypothetical protein n=1 Tax=Pedobacter sp. HMWF019 TaxID=2056856 RepID=UPI000D36A67E|nr:hypothetical protein [Pedobacter sp. HMWF019]PTT03539.1 hypothetical protein DBR11_01980 [Pedobacter sp. HMWF019]
MTKKIFMIGALLAALTFANTKANAQAVSGTVAVNLILSDAYSIVLGPTPDVTFTYATAADYSSSKNVLKSSHFTVVSNKPYSVAVKANSAFNTISTTTPPLSAVQISVDPSTITGATYTTATLTQANQTIAAAASPTIGTAYNINYAIPTAAPLLAMSAGTYTTNVVYTVTQP